MCLRIGAYLYTGAETCLRIGAYLYTGGRSVPQNRGRFMHGGQKRTSELGQVYARCAEACLRIGAGLCTGGKAFPRFQADYSDLGIISLKL